MRYPYGKSILITGASSGIGRAAAELFAGAGYTVWAGSRHCEEGIEQWREGEIRSIPMDVCDEASARRAVERAVSEGGLGIVLNCAGMGIAGPAEDTFEEAIRAQFEVNYFGTLRVNRLALPYLRAQGKGLVLVMSSVAGRVPLPYQSHYSSSKYALDAYVEALRMEGRPFGIRAALIEPGDTKTGFTAARRMAMPEDSPYRAACEGAVARMAHDEETGAPAAKPAMAALRLSERENPPVRVTVGAMYQGVMALRKLLPARVFERALAAMYR
ncbi:MAG TPA: SDR family oxidoreductase [Candidatus Fimivicinus intestinavium]|nr:SDR family oxidoreductase [Candidatus Fimivicinus intestinavium]